MDGIQDRSLQRAGNRPFLRQGSRVLSSVSIDRPC